MPALPLEPMCAYLLRPLTVEETTVPWNVLMLVETHLSWLLDVAPLRAVLMPVAILWLTHVASHSWMLAEIQLLRTDQSAQPPTLL